MKDETTKNSKLRDDAIVISGISGLFPNADNTVELSEKLYNKVDMVTGNVYPDIKHPELPQHYGKVNDVTKFDSQFFRVTPKQAESFEPCGRKIMEQAYSAIFDAGINPETLRGTKLGVFVGFAQSDTVMCLYRSLISNGFIVSGCSKTMLANRVSYWIDAKGPSFSLDVGCASSMACLEIACERIMDGDCDAALVSGCSYNNKPVLSLNMKRAGLLCLDGKTKCFDENGDGYVRSEAVSVLFLQKAKDAKRIYSEICYVKGKYFPKPDSTFLPTHNHSSLQTFFEEFYSKINFNPDDVEYVEANAPGISTSDQSELEAISKVFGKNHPVKIGCVKSNLGNAESASGVVGIIKICLAYQRGELPANINLTKPLDIVAMNENNLKIITDNTNFNRGYTAINNFSYHGANFHALLRCPYIRKETNRYNTEFPRLVLVSGRTKEGINKIFDTLEKSTIDPEQIALLNNIYKYDIPGHTGRGFAIFESNENGPSKALSREFEFYSGTRRPICFMYSGMGSQWAGMGAQLMQIPIFSTAIKKCQTALESKGLNLVDIITNKNVDISNNILYSLTGITAIQIGLTDVLKAIGILPDFIIGHSLGEIGCSYADGSLTAEEAITISYYRGFVSATTEFIKGKMAAIGLGYKQLSCPADIDVACHNSSMSTTISGPADAVDKFVESLKERNIFAKTVSSSDIAFHSRYIAEAGPKLFSLVRDLIKKPKQRGKKWLSTCYAPNDWDLEESQLASAEYFACNMMGKVLFEEAAENIPDDAVIVEIAPYGLMQSILKKSHESCLNLALLKRNHDQNIKVLLESIGKFHQNGLNPQIEILYPKVEFPVSTETQGLSHLVDWEHSMEWDIYYYMDKTNKHTAMYAQFVLSIYDEEYSFIKHYIRNGDNILPESFILVLVWKTLAMYKEVNYTDLAVQFKDIKFHNDVLIRSSEVIKLCIFIQKVSNKFEVTLEDDHVVSGYINEMNFKDEYYANNDREFDYNQPHLNKNSVYKLLSMHGYNLGEKWQCIEALNFNKRVGAIEWNYDWTYFIDSILQLNILSESEYKPSRVRFISSLQIDVKKQNKSIIYDDKNGKQNLYADRHVELGETVCGGVFCESIVFKKLPLQQTPIQLFTQKFVPHICNYPVNFQTAISINMQLVSENTPNEKIKMYFVQSEYDRHILNLIKHTMLKMSMLDADLDVIESNDVVNVNFNTDTMDVLIFTNIWKSKVTKYNFLDTVNNNTFVMLIEDKKDIDLKYLENNGFALITLFDVDDKDIILVKKTKKYNLNRYIISSTMDQLKSKLQNLHNNMIFISDKNEFTNITSCKDTIKKLLKKEITVSILDIDEPPLLPLNINVFLQNQVKKGLAFNILRNEQWGGYYQVPLKSNVEVGNAMLTAKLNNFDAFQWTEPLTVTNNIDAVVEVYFAGIVMKDCDDILNENKMTNFGMDYSGIDSSGRRIMGCVYGGSIATSIQTDPDLLWPVPKHWSLEDAATVPLPYVHAYYCLTIKYNLLRRSIVLVTGGAGALGQALISICLSMECKVLATVKSERKKKLLIHLFPQIEEKNIEISITDEFADKFRNYTNGKNCDVVINCYNSKIRQAAMKCVAENGIFLDLSQDDMKENELFEFGYLKGCRNYTTVRLSSVFTEENNISNKKMLQAYVTEGIERGIVKPITRVVYSMSNVSKAFKLMTKRRQIGRILINMKEDSSLVYKEPRLIFNTQKVYIVVWDGSEIGIELINRLIKRGAKNLIIKNTKPLDYSYFQAKYLNWLKSVNLVCYDKNLNTANGCKLFIECGSKIGPIDGIFLISSYIEENNDAHNTDDLILSNLERASRDITNLSYFATVKLVPSEFHKEDTESDQRISEREKLGLPSLTLIYRLKNMDFSLKKMLTFLNVFEKCLCKKENRIFFTDLDINVSHSSNETKHDSDNKLSMFIDTIETEETEAIEPLFSMNTLISKLKSDELVLNPNEDIALVLSGFLGNHKTLSKSTERLKISAYYLQIAPDVGGSIFDLAKNLLKYVKMRFKLKSKFYIVAHSFGVNVALEMAALLEQEGYFGTVFCLDSSPLALQHQIKSYLGDFTENEFQNCIIENMYSLIAQDSPADLTKDLNGCNNWTEKTSVFINNIKYKVSHTHQYLNDLINAIYNRLVLAMAYKPNLKLNSEIVLIKGLPDPKINILPDDYDLTQYTSKPIKVFNVTSDHMSLPNDPNISTIINEMLEPEILKLYDKKNLCEDYYS